MHQWWDNSHGKQLLAFCGGEETESSLSTLAEVNETCGVSSAIRIPVSTSEQQLESPKLDHYGLFDSPPPLRVTSPSSLSTWSPEPSSPIGWNDDEFDDDECDSDKRFCHEEMPNSPRLVTSDLEQGAAQRRLAPSLFSPWLCVYDLDAACGSGSYVDSVVDESVASDTGTLQALQLSQSPRSAVVSHPMSTTSSKPLAPIDWNGRLSSLDLSVWFGHRDLKCAREPDPTAVCATRRGPTSGAAAAQHGPKPMRPIPVYPLSDSSHYFSDFASDNGIEAIFLPVRLRTLNGFSTSIVNYAVSRLFLLVLQTKDMLTDDTADDSMHCRRVPVTQSFESLTPAAAAAASRPITCANAQELVQFKTRSAARSTLKDLPALRNAAPATRKELFVNKLKLCSIIISFDDPTTETQGKDMKRQTLLELVDYVNTPAGQLIFTESIMGYLMFMVSANICRSLPPATADFDPEEDEPICEPAWPHLQVVYKLLLQFICSSKVNAKAAKKYVNQKFCWQLVELFDSEDPRERDCLKTILHHIYGKFMSNRSFILLAISNVFYQFVYETERHNGIGELLEILGSIINGFAIPLKKEHWQFLARALIPLHKPKCVALYHQQLSYCIIQYVAKDADTATIVLNGFFRCWPWSCSSKQVMFLNELEAILELLGAEQLAQVSTMLFTNLARCLDCVHFQVVERALFLWNNERLVSSGCLLHLNAHTVLPIIYGPLYRNSSGHWNATVEVLAQNVLKMYREYDSALFDKCTKAYLCDEEEAKQRLDVLTKKWHAIEQAAIERMPEIMAT
jgi:serine/threonine-protein phosphatase 2A regulatory subunit B'